MAPKTPTAHTHCAGRIILSLRRALHLLSLSIRRSYASTSALVAAGVQLVHTVLSDCFIFAGVGASDTIGKGVNVAVER